MTRQEIRDLRDRLGWSRERLAQELGVSASTIVRWEAGATRPSNLATQALERLTRRVRAGDVQVGSR